MRISSLQSQVERLNRQLIGELTVIQIEDGSVVHLRGSEEALELLVEAIEYRSYNQPQELSEKALKVRKALPGQGAYVDTVKRFLREE